MMQTLDDVGIDATLAAAREAIVHQGIFCYADSGEDDPHGVAVRLMLDALALPQGILIIRTSALEPDKKPENLRRSIDPALFAADALTAPTAPSPTPAPHQTPEKRASTPPPPSAELLSDAEQAALLDRRLRQHDHRLLALGAFSEGQRYGLAKLGQDGTELTIFQGPLAAVEALAHQRVFNTQPREWQGRTITL